MAFDSGTQHHGIDRFVDEIIAACSKSLGQMALFASASDEKDWRDPVGIHLSYHSTKLNATGPRHFHVQEKYINPACPGDGNGVISALCLEHRVALTFKHRCDRVSYQ